MGACKNDSNAPTGNCIHGDDYASSGMDLNSLLTFPTQHVSCATAINTLVANKMDPVFWCKSDTFNFKKTCCASCAGKLIILLKNIQVINFFFHYF
jgi:hypothetical protein